MAGKRTRKAQENLRKKFRTGVQGNPGSSNVKIESIQVDGPDHIEVGKPFRLAIKVEPRVDDWAYLTVKKGTPCGYETRELTRKELESILREGERKRCVRKAKVSYAVGICPQCYGMIPLVDGIGTIAITQYTREAFELKITVGRKSETWGLTRDQVECPEEASGRK